MGREGRVGSHAVTSFIALLALCALALVAGGAPASAAPTSTTLTAAPTTVEVGVPVTLTATVSGTSLVGSVDFAEGSTLLGTVPVSSGVAQLAVTFATAGSHQVTATYTADAGNDPSQGSTTVTVTAPVPPSAPPPPRPRVTLRGSATSVSVGDKVKLTWRTKHATSVKAGGDWSGSKQRKGSAWVRITTRGENVFTLTATNAAGSRTARVTVTATRKAKTFELAEVTAPVLAGSKLSMDVDGLAPGESFTVRLGKVVLASGKADRHGIVSRTLVVPKATKEGVWDLTLTGSNPDRVGTVPVTVITPTKTLGVSVAHRKAVTNGTDVLTVTGLVPDEPVTVRLDDVLLRTGAADAKGVFHLTFEVGSSAGDRTVTVEGAAPGRTGQVVVHVHSPTDGSAGRLTLAS